MEKKRLAVVFCFVFSCFGLALSLLAGFQAPQQSINWENLITIGKAYFASPSPGNAQKLCSALPESDVPGDARDESFVKASEYFYTHLYALEMPMQTDKQALEIAFRLLNISDGGFSEELYNFIGDVMDVSPRLFLEVLRGNSNRTDVVCSGRRFMGLYSDETKSEYNEELTKRIKTLLTVSDENLVPLRDKCIEKIKKCFLK